MPESLKVEEQKRKILIIVFGCVYFGASILIFVYQIIGKGLFLAKIATSFIATGVGIAVIAFVSLNRYGGRGGGPDLRTEKQFMKWRQQHKYRDDIIWTIILAAVFLLITGLIITQYN